MNTPPPHATRRMPVSATPISHPLGQHVLDELLYARRDEVEALAKQQPFEQLM